MFGLKIRNWMERNIVRPKRNKSKQKQANLPIEKRSTSVLLSEPVSSPARRSEISPIQNHTYSRAGWQTPEINQSPFHEVSIRSKSDSPVKKFQQIPQLMMCQISYRSTNRVEIAEEKLPTLNRSSTGIKMSPPKKEKSSKDTGSTKNSNYSVFPSNEKTKSRNLKPVQMNNSGQMTESSTGVISYLSSPESAYSTGYSTDCTSPGGISESVYVNMRTGHCIPPNKIPNGKCLESFKNGFNIMENIYGMVKPLDCYDQSKIHHPPPARMESPSPRQRCRIRTNPWLNTSAVAKSPLLQVRNGNIELQSPKFNRNQLKEVKQPAISSWQAPSPNTLRKRKIEPENKENSVKVLAAESVEDVTLQEMMGKYDESYVYEKETDILSDSDATQCQESSDLEDNEGDDEYDEDIDFIDNNNELKVETPVRNSGSCEYYPAHEQIPNKITTRSIKSRKKLVRRTRKKSQDRSSLQPSVESSDWNGRECRSVGGTPLLVRKMNSSKQPQKTYDLNGNNRCNSLIFQNNEAIARLTIAKSEKQLLKADLEAFIKYKKLINEAENILDTMKMMSHPTPKPPTAPQCVMEPCFALSPSKTTFVPPANKRVEMLRHCEMPKRPELPSPKYLGSPVAGRTMIVPNPQTQFLVNKKIELIKNEYAKTCRSGGNNLVEFNHPSTKITLPNQVPAITINFNGDYACPQSEPLKRKVYYPSVVPNSVVKQPDPSSRMSNNNRNAKHQLIMTLEELKRNLECQKTELCGLNDDD